jgi:hypothetical protein
MQLRLPEVPPLHEQDPGSHYQHTPAHTISELPLLTHLDLWGFNGNPTHLLLVSRMTTNPLEYCAHVSCYTTLICALWFKVMEGEQNRAPHYLLGKETV